MYDGHSADTWTHTNRPKNYYNEYLIPLKMPKYAENMQYVHFDKICGKCGKVPNM